MFWPGSDADTELPICAPTSSTERRARTTRRPPNMTHVTALPCARPRPERAICAASDCRWRLSVGMSRTRRSPSADRLPARDRGPTERATRFLAQAGFFDFLAWCVRRRRRSPSGKIGALRARVGTRKLGDDAEDFFSYGFLAITRALGTPRTGRRDACRDCDACNDQSHTCRDPSESAHVLLRPFLSGTAQR